MKIHVNFYFQMNIWGYLILTKMSFRIFQLHSPMGFSYNYIDLMFIIMMLIRVPGVYYSITEIFNIFIAKRLSGEVIQV